jgi:phytoene dehydrogenase-like protein
VTVGRPEVAIVGAGLSGLACALRLHQAGMPFLVLESSDAVGGRVRTDVVDGFRLDRGFQVLLADYPEARRVLDYAALDLRAFEPGALVWKDGRFRTLGDPWRRPGKAWATLRSGIGSFRDMLRIARLRAEVLRGPLEAIFRRPETSTRERLRGVGFSSDMIESFLRPLFAGILHDPDLRASSRMFDFVFRMLARGDTVVPAAGMGAIPEQMAARLPQGSIRLRARVASIGPGKVRLESGEVVEARAVVIAVEGPEAARLTGRLTDPGSRSVTCLYFAAEAAPVSEPVLMLDGERRGPVNNLCFPSQIAPAYAPPGATLVSPSVLEGSGLAPAAVEDAARAQLETWFGPQVRSWRHLRTYHILLAQPDQLPPALDTPERPVRLAPGLYVCGDHRDTASIHGAMVSGRRAAAALLAAERGSPAPSRS